MDPRTSVAAAVLALLMMPAAAESQEVKLTPLFALETLDQAEADPAFEGRTLEQLGNWKSATGFTGEMLLLRKDRGPHAGRYAVFVTGPEGVSAFRNHVIPHGEHTIYQLVGADQLQPLPTVDVLAVHYIEVKPGQEAAFEKLVTEKLNPAVGNLRPDLRFLYYKGMSGPAAGSYITVVAITKASRDKYWPGGSDSDDLKTAFTPQIRALATDELQPSLVENSFGVNMAAQIYEAREWADWFVVTAPAR